MANVTFSNFKNGLDTRRSELTTQPGALLELQDAHINEGAEIEKRFAFLNASYVPENALSLEVTGEGFTPGYLGGTVVFGSGALITTTLSRQNVAGVVTLTVSAANPIYTWVAGDTINVINLGVNANSGFDSYNGNFVLTSVTYITGSPNYYSLVYSVADTTSETITTDLKGVVGWGLANVVTYPLNSFGSATVVSRSVSAGVVTMVLSAPPIYGVVNGNSIAIIGAAYAECVVPLSLLKVATGYQITFIATANTEQAGDTVYWPGGFTTYVYYQPVVHPAVQDGATFDATYHALTAITASTSFGGFTWVSATFSDGNTFAYWGKNYVPAFRNGQVLNGWSTNQNIAVQLANAITLGNLTGFVVGTPTVNGTGYQFILNSAPNQTFSVVTSPNASNAGTGTIASTLISNSVTPVAGVGAAANFTITGGSTAGVATCTAIYVGATDPPGGTNLLSAAVGFNGSTANMAQFIALNINANTALNGAWSAVATGSQLTIYDNAARGTSVNGYFLKVVGTGDFCTDNIIFNFNSNATWGTGVTKDTVTSILYNTTGATTVEILGTTMTFKDSGHSTETLLQFVGRIATQIIGNAAGYTAFVLNGVSPSNTVNLIVSRLTTDSGTAVGTNGCVLTYSSYAGSVANGLSGGTSNYASTLVAVVSPKVVVAGYSGNVSFTVAVTGGVGTFTYNWSLVIQHGSPSKASIFGANNGASVMVTILPFDSPTSCILTCVVTDQVGNTATDTANIVGVS